MVETPRASLVESPKSSSSETPRNSVSDTPRGSWASSVFDLRNSQADPLLPGLLDKVPVEFTDKVNESQRQQDRQESLFTLFPIQDEVQ